MLTSMEVRKHSVGFEPWTGCGDCLGVIQWCFGEKPRLKLRLLRQRMLDGFSCGILHSEFIAKLIFRAHAQGLVFALVVFAEEGGQALMEFADRLVAPDMNIIILHGVPQSFNHNVVQSASFAIRC